MRRIVRLASGKLRMNKNLFRDAGEILSECDHLVRIDADDAYDRGVISAFYNGRATMSEKEAEDAGITELKNHLFGYDSMSTAKAQLSSIYTKGRHIWKVELGDAPLQLRQSWEMCITDAWNAAIKRSRKFKAEYDGLCGDVTLYGRGSLYFRDQTEWCPRLTEPLVPRKSGTRPDEIEYVVIRDEILLKDLFRYGRIAERRPESGWKAKEIEKVGKAMRDVTYDDDKYDEAEFDRQEGAFYSGETRLALPVYFVYQTRPEEKDCPIDLTIVVRYASGNKPDGTQAYVEEIIFDKERFFKKACQFLHPAFLDANLGGRTTWHRVMGLGRLNYDSDVDVEEFFNAAMQGSKENLQRMFQVSKSSDAETIERWLAGGEWSNILPEGVSVAEVAKNPNFQYAFTTMQMLQNLTKGNAQMAIGNQRGDRGANELEVQAMERQGRNAQVLAHRMSEWYEYMDHLGAEIFRRFLSPVILESEVGFEEVSWFRKELEKNQVPIDVIRSYLKAGSICVKTSREMGEGNVVKERMINQQLMGIMPQLSPQAQEKVKRRVIASETGDYELANELVPYEVEPDLKQVERANNENDTCMLRGIAGYVPPINKDDIHLAQIPEHFGGMQGLIALGQNGFVWTPREAGGFQAMGAHVAQHILYVERAGNTQMAEQAKAALMNLGRAGQQLMAQMQKVQQQQQVSPLEQAKIKDMEGNRQLAVRKQMSIEADRDRKYDLAEYKAGIDSASRESQLGLQQEQLAQSAIESNAKREDAYALKMAEQQEPAEEQPTEQPDPAEV